MKILFVGGGSGGHITPIIAVIREIFRQKPRTQIEFWTDRKYYKNVVKITTETEIKWRETLDEGSKGFGMVTVRKLSSGKFRRYSGWKLWDYFENFEITFKDLIIGNFINLIGFLIGIVQSFVRLFRKKTRPDLIFLKGGFVGLPVGIVARLFKIPYLIHESDSAMGLANRILSKHATKILLGQPNKNIEQAKSIIVGVPVAEEFTKITKTKQKELKRSFGFNPGHPLVVITGGSQGSLHINLAIKEIIEQLLEISSVGLVAGRKYFNQVLDLKEYEIWQNAKLKSNFRLWKFNNSMHDLLGSADIVISRAGATTIMELANLASPAVILVPFEKLPNSHQVLNADHLAKNKSAKVLVDEKMVKNPSLLVKLVKELLDNPDERSELVSNLNKIANPDAAKNIANIIINLVSK